MDVAEVGKALAGNKDVVQPFFFFSPFGLSPFFGWLVMKRMVVLLRLVVGCEGEILNPISAGGPNHSLVDRKRKLL